MKIGIVAFGFYPGQTGGTETYFRNLLNGLQDYDKINNYTLIVDPMFVEQATELVFNKGWQVKGLPQRPSLLMRILRKAKFVRGDDESLLAQRISRLGLDLVHFPFQIIYPKGVKTKKVVTFHDMQEKHYPEFFTREELEARANTFGPTIFESDIIISISRYTEYDLERYYKAGYKCEVVYHSYDSNKSDALDDLPESLISGKYFYYPAATWPHKNHERLIKAFARVHIKHPEYQLVFTGISRQQTVKIKNLVKSLHLGKAVVNLGYVDYAILPSIYANAFALVYPSLFEGFGLPLLEAMNVRTPVIASNTSSVPEVGGDAVLYCDPMRISDIASKMNQLIQEPGLRASLVGKGKRQITKFTTKKMIAGTLRAYNRAYYGR